MPGGERFNPKQTNEERRHVSNLLLMCYDHHIETDDVARFSVEAMKRIKSDHENKFSDIIGTMYLSVSDHTERGIPVFPKTLARMNRILGWKLTSDELDEIIKTSRISFEKIVQIPLPTRKLFRIMLTRAHKCNYHGQTDLEVSVPDLQQATGLSDDNFWSCISILDKA